MGVLELSSLDFSAPAETHSFDGLLFDFDGTVVDSTEAIVNHWHKSVFYASDWPATEWEITDLGKS